MLKHERLGGTQIPHSVGGELWWHPHWLVFFMCSMSPHSSLEYGMVVIGWRETWLSQFMVWWNVVVPSLVVSLHYMKNSFLWFFMWKCTDVYMDFDDWYFYCIFFPIMLFIWTFTPEGDTKWYHSFQIQTLGLDGLYRRWNEEKRLKFRHFCHMCYKFSSVAY